MKRYSSNGSIAFVLAAALVSAAAGALADAPKDDGTMKEAEKAFRAMEEKLANAKTLECYLEIKCDFGGQMGTETLSYQGLLLLDEGNKARQEIKELAKGPPMRLLMVSDGAHLSMQDNGMAHPTLEDTPKYLNRDILTWVACSGVFLPDAPLPDVEAADAKERFPVSGFKLGFKEKVDELRGATNPLSTCGQGSRANFLGHRLDRRGDWASAQAPAHFRSGEGKVHGDRNLLETQIG